LFFGTGIDFPGPAKLIQRAIGLFRDRSPVERRFKPVFTSPPIERHGVQNTGMGKGAVKMIAKVDGKECTGCGVCVDECPGGAIRVDDIALVDAALCTGCGACVDACPSGALSMA
jgi:Na+-translocating ferredoxin:NAD+ oxidoreductase RNF subunit RnfB